MRCRMRRTASYVSRRRRLGTWHANVQARQAGDGLANRDTDIACRFGFTPSSDEEKHDATTTTEEEDLPDHFRRRPRRNLIAVMVFGTVARFGDLPRLLGAHRSGDR